MAREVVRDLVAAQLFAHSVDQLVRLALAERGVIEVEARKHRVGRSAEHVLGAFQDIHDAAVRAAREQRGLAVFRDQ